MTARWSHRVLPGARTAGLVGVAALSAVTGNRDYRAWRALGEGGLPATPVGWAGAWVLRLAARNTTRPARHRRAIGTRADQARLGSLPPRNGPRPRTARWPVPHRQVDQIAGTGMRRALDDLVADTVNRRSDVVTFRTSTFETHGPAVTLCDPAAGHPDARGGSGEVGHVHHSDGSVHLILSPSDAVTVLTAGWGERHPLSGVLPGLPATYLLVYPPRDHVELAVVSDLFNAAIDHLAGIPLTVPPARPPRHRPTDEQTAPGQGGAAAAIH